MRNGSGDHSQRAWCGGSIPTLIWERSRVTSTRSGTRKVRTPPKPWLRRPRSLWVVILMALGTACGGGLPEGYAVLNPLLDSVLPGVRLGSRAAPPAERYHLTVAPYVGYGDSTARPAPGCRGLYLVVSPHLVSEADVPSPGSRVTAVHVGLESWLAAQSLVAFVSARLGAPEHYCDTSGKDNVRFRLTFWPAGGRQGLMMRFRSDTAGAGLMIFNAVRPDSSRTVPGRCAIQPAAEAA